MTEIPKHKTPGDHLRAATQWLAERGVVPEDRANQYTNHELVLGLSGTIAADDHRTATAAEFNCHLKQSSPTTINRWVAQLCACAGLDRRKDYRQNRRTFSRTPPALGKDLLKRLRESRDCAKDIAASPMSGPFQIYVWDCRGLPTE